MRPISVAAPVAQTTASARSVSQVPAYTMLCRSAASASVDGAASFATGNDSPVSAASRFREQRPRARVRPRARRRRLVSNNTSPGTSSRASISQSSPWRTCARRQSAQGAVRGRRAPPAAPSAAFSTTTSAITAASRDSPSASATTAATSSSCTSGFAKDAADRARAAGAARAVLSPACKYAAASLRRARGRASDRRLRAHDGVRCRSVRCGTRVVGTRVVGTHATARDNSSCVLTAPLRNDIPRIRPQSQRLVASFRAWPASSRPCPMAWPADSRLPASAQPRQACGEPLLRSSRRCARAQRGGELGFASPLAAARRRADPRARLPCVRTALIRLPMASTSPSPCRYYSIACAADPVKAPPVAPGSRAAQDSARDPVGTNG